MDFYTAPPPRPPSLAAALSKANDVYDYIFIDSGSPDSYLSADVGSIVNETFLNGSSRAIENATDLGTAGIGLNGTDTVEPLADVIVMAVTSLVLGLMILVTVIGNVFVIAAIILERNLQNVANYLVASLAVADLFVACLVMPLGAVYEISRGWILGPELCDIWTSCDVLCCTASILHLVAIATDRYWAVTNIDYIHSRTSRRVFTMIFLVWFASVIVSLAPQFGWKDPEYLERIEQQKCIVSQNIAYQVFATCCTFYVPLFVILVLYWKIYQTARRRIHRRAPKLPATPNSSNQEETPKPKSKIRFHLKKKFTNPSKSAVSSLGLVEGNSTNTVNTVEDTEDSANHHQADPSRKPGLETTFSGDEGVPLSNNQIPTVSYEVTHRQQAAATGAESNNNNRAVAGSKSVGLSAGNGSHGPASVPLLAASTTLQQQQQPSSPTSTHHHQSLHPSPSPSPSLGHATQMLKPPQSAATAMAPAASGNGAGSQLQGAGSSLNIASTPNPQAQVSKRKETLEAKRERKAAKTLAIITGAFVVCWLPFFLTALLLPLCESCSINDTVASLFLWLGYFNSTLNPVIYTIFSPEFRQAFKRILFGSHRSATYRRGML
ncbi:5-hydroxytryptamine receptor-like [Anopheles albimanus]|uniref:5-hydroxytryptamine receptor-like n=1 Tax=Anopheles albimanus TaxID=7167 RepID=UPI001641B8FD|nr:5-hydroxytryptamine receptor-like [Anopheles albimanus]XP_035785207.1 5-hydroxytryptamine receptor-like [Anopheles albimanus]XP_035785208.1 5-hydroxytryptamine receptor-like [Anopheles albimanus]